MQQTTCTQLRFQNGHSRTVIIKEGTESSLFSIRRNWGIRELRSSTDTRSTSVHWYLESSLQLTALKTSHLVSTSTSLAMLVSDVQCHFLFEKHPESRQQNSVASACRQRITQPEAYEGKMEDGMEELASCRPHQTLSSPSHDRGFCSAGRGKLSGQPCLLAPERGYWSGTGSCWVELTVRPVPPVSYP